MAMVRMNMGGMVGSTHLGVELDIPADVLKQGQAAIVAWCNKNLATVDAATMKAIQHTDYLKQVIDVHGIEVME